MSTPAISALEQNIRDRSDTETERQFNENWQKAFYWKPMLRLSKEEWNVISSVHERLLAITKQKAADQAVMQFLNTYRNLIHQFPDLVDTGEQEGGA